MIGVFDSGFGGLTILRALVDRLPQYAYLYLGDNARVPYGSRSAEEIFQFTKEGVDWLFSQGCELVILGCNAASANALRRIQQTVMPTRYPSKKVLGILVPTVEQIAGEGNAVLVLATEATVRSRAYTSEVHKRVSDMTVYERACPAIVPLIESDASPDELRAAVRACASDIPSDVNAVILGCTHYPLIEPMFREAIPSRIPIYDQAKIVASKTEGYLARHSEIKERLETTKTRRFATTGDPEAVSRLAGRFFGEPMDFEKVTLASR